jgi:hypothetical protein
MSDMAFDVRGPLDLLERVLLPTYEEFLANNASSRHALQATLVAYHMFDWVNKKYFSAEAFREAYCEPEYAEMVDYFEIARGLTNGFKHFHSPLPGKEHTGARVVTTVQTGFSSGFSDGYARPLNAKDISVDILLRKLVEFWKDQRAKGALS